MPQPVVTVDTPKGKLIVIVAKVRERLYLGGEHSPEDTHGIRALGITHIVNVTQKLQRDKNLHGHLNYMQVRVADKDYERLTLYFEKYPTTFMPRSSAASQSSSTPQGEYLRVSSSSLRI
jgi:hypothetical protein